MSVLPDGGSRTSFQQGEAIREGDETRPALEGISPFMLIRLGNLLRRADRKYGDYRNWEKGMPFHRYIGGISRHLALLMLRDESEDHLAAIVWNVMCMIHHQELGQDQMQELDDRPVWKRLPNFKGTKWLVLSKDDEPIVADDEQLQAVIAAAHPEDREFGAV